MTAPELLQAQVRMRDGSLSPPEWYLVHQHKFYPLEQALRQPAVIVETEPCPFCADVAAVKGSVLVAASLTATYMPSIPEDQCVVCCGRGFVPRLSDQIAEASILNSNDKG